MKIRCVLLGMMFLGACLSAEAGIKRQNYAAYAGEPVREMRFFDIYNWQRTSARTMVVWTKPSAAYLLTFSNNCDILDGQFTIGIGDVDGDRGRLQSGSSSVKVGSVSCPIRLIQPIDLQRMKLDRKA